VATLEARFALSSWKRTATELTGGSENRASIFPRECGTGQRVAEGFIGTSNAFELRDVPWVQDFERGYALHASYWHDDFGKPRSHGCINLAPVDARRLFFWTDPPLPTGWHGVKSGGPTSPGTWVRVRG
jgi:hypothetical protein